MYIEIAVSNLFVGALSIPIDDLFSSTLVSCITGLCLILPVTSVFKLPMISVNPLIILFDNKFGIAFCTNEPSLLSNYLEEQYLSNEFQDGDILEHSTLLVNLYEELNSILKKKFFFSATDYGYLEIPRKSTLRLVSKHTKVNLFEKFENVDYSFGVNFGLFSNFFKNFFPLVISQHELINNFIPFEYKISKDKNIMKTIEMISGDGFYKMGKTFFNISFFQK